MEPSRACLYTMCGKFSKHAFILQGIVHPRRLVYTIPMQTMEILAPAGGREQLYAAVRCGADAVYLGTHFFNARRAAENFTEEGLADAVSYCHARNVRVYVTLNTLILDDELETVRQTLREIAQSGADAVIVQDIAAVRLVKTHCPGLALHASTQMAVHNVAGVRQLEALGFERVVLARELSLAEMTHIAQNTALDLEVFVHGALCMSVSGACTLSSMLGGRSGNRGMCAQPCRLNFRAGKREYALSLKDLSALDHLDSLRSAGICSLKIEGRMKRAEYVAAAVTACREALNGHPYDREILQAAFSRGGFTDGYLTAKRGLSMFGIRGMEDAQASRQAQAALSTLYRNERPSVPVDMALTLHNGEASSLWVSDGENTITAKGDIPQTALHIAIDESRARQSLAKTGGTPFSLRHLKVTADESLMLPASSLNALRRDALGELLSIRQSPCPKAFLETPPSVITSHQTTESPGFRVRVETAAQLWGGIDTERVIVPLREVTSGLLAVYGDRLVAELPFLIFPNEEINVRKKLALLVNQGLTAVQADNLGAISLAREAGLRVLGGAGLNILNSVALDAYQEMGLEDATISFELHRQKLRALSGGIRRGAIAYGRLPLMRMRCCPAQTAEGCGACIGNTKLCDRKGIDFPLLCENKQYTTLLNSVPLDLSGDLLDGADFQTLYFTIESQAECRSIYERFLAGEPPEDPYTRGLYMRSLL